MVAWTRKVVGAILGAGLMGAMGLLLSPPPCPESLKHHRLRLCWEIKRESEGSENTGAKHWSAPIDAASKGGSCRGQDRGRITPRLGSVPLGAHKGGVHGLKVPQLEGYTGPRGTPSYSWR